MLEDRSRWLRLASDRSKDESGVSAVEYGILVAAAAVVLIGGMVAVGAASDAVFDTQAASASGPANNVLDAGADGTDFLDDLGEEDIDVGELEVDSQGNTWTVSFTITFTTDDGDPLPDGTLVPVSGFWEAQSTDPSKDFTPVAIGSCEIAAGQCVISRLFYSSGGGNVAEPTVDRVSVVDLVVNGAEFPSPGPVTR